MLPSFTRWRVWPSRPTSLPDMFELLGHALVVGDDLVERVGDLAEEARLVPRHAHRKIARLHRLQRMKQLMQLGACGRSASRVRRRVPDAEGVASRFFGSS